MIARPRYLEKLVRSMWNGEVKVITGIRRCGKSVLLFDLFRQYLLGTGVEDSSIIALELDQRKNARFRNPITLCDYVDSIVTVNRDRRFYLFIDEVQLSVTVPDLANGGMKVTIYDMLNELKSHENLDVYVTGSNSKGLSTDIATEFRGRATQIRVHPLSFAEFFQAVGGDERRALDEYLLYGGLPRITALENEKDKKEYLTGLFGELYIKDLVERNGIERPDVLGDILDYLASQVGSLTNPANVANALSATRGDAVNSTMAANYIGHCIDAFLIAEARRYDVKGKDYFKYPNKYYYTDLGLRNARLNYRQYDPGHLVENAIYNELVLRGYSVDVGVVTDRANGAKLQREIDFVVNDADRRIYIQSALRMDTEDKQAVELRSLLLTHDFFKKVVIRNDIPHSYYDENGILHCNLIAFLSGNVELF